MPVLVNILKLLSGFGYICCMIYSNLWSRDGLTRMDSKLVGHRSKFFKSDELET